MKMIYLNFFSYLDRKAISSQKALNLVPRLHSWNVKNSKLLLKWIFKLFRNNNTYLKRKRHGMLVHKVFFPLKSFVKPFFYFSFNSVWVYESISCLRGIEFLSLSKLTRLFELLSPQSDWGWGFCFALTTELIQKTLDIAIQGRLKMWTEHSTPILLIFMPFEIS